MASYKVTWHIGYDGLGAREVLYWNNAAAGLQQCISDTIALSNLRLKLLARPFAIEGVSIDAIPTFGQQRMLYNEIGPIRTGLALGAGCDDEAACYYVRLSDSSHKWHRAFHLHGLPQQVSSAVTLGGAVDLSAAKFLKPLQAWIKGLGAYTPPGSAPPAQNWSLWRRGNAADNNNLPRQKVLAVGVDATTGDWQVVVPNALNPSPGQIVHIHGLPGCCFRGLNGDQTVKKVSTSAPPLPAGNVLLFARKPCCSCTGFTYNGKATAYLKVLNFTPIAFAFPSRVVDKKMGQPDFVRSGRGPSKCGCK